MGRHRDTIRTLVHSIHDAPSAETYCTTAGDVISTKVAAAIGEQYKLTEWAALITGDGKETKQRDVDDETKKDLSKTLLEVYMSKGYVPLASPRLASPASSITCICQ